MSSNGTAERLMSEAQETATKLSELAAQVEAALKEVAAAEIACGEVDRAIKVHREAMETLEASVTLEAMMAEKINGKNAETRALQTKDILNDNEAVKRARGDLHFFEIEQEKAHQRRADAEAVAKAIYHQLQALQSKASLQVAMLNLFTATIDPMNLGRTEVIPVKMPSF